MSDYIRIVQIPFKSSKINTLNITISSGLSVWTNKIVESHS